MKYLILLFLIISCGTRKVDTVKRDSISINNTYSNGSKIVLSTDVIFEPIDVLKPFKIDGKEYVNVKVTNSKKEIVEKWKNRNIVKTITVEKTKLSEKKDNSNLWIGLFAVLVAGIIIYLKIKRLITLMY
jgi:hypothetical protein